MSSMFPTVNFLINASSVAVLWLGANLINSGEVQVGSLVAYLTYLVQILMSVVMATFMISMIPRASVSAGRIQEVLDTDVSVVPPPEPVRELITPGSLELRNVGFLYPGAEHAVLSDISFLTTPGQMTAIVGSTGAGKTTLVNLIPRLFDSTSGAVLVGGVDVRELDPDILWQTIGLVPQRPYLFSWHCGEQPSLRQAGCHRRADVGGARGRAGPRLRGGHAGWPERPYRAGRHERVGRAAPTTFDRSGARAEARHLRVRRLVLGARPRHRRRACAPRSCPTHATRQ